MRVSDRDDLRQLSILILFFFLENSNGDPAPILPPSYLTLTFTLFTRSSSFSPDSFLAFLLLPIDIGLLGSSGQIFIF